MNWKVRRASAKTLAAIIISRSELLEELYKEVAHSLVARFKEREETVKLEVFHTFSQLLTRTRAANNPKYVLCLRNDWFCGCGCAPIIEPQCD
jgi:hypothetical protein